MVLHPCKKISIRRALGYAVFVICIVTGYSIKEARGESLDTSLDAQEIVPEIPYQVDGIIYYPLKDTSDFSEEGVASWYGPTFHGQLTSSKEVYDMNGMTAAHKTLPFNTMVKVINLENGAQAVVRINDRGPFSKQRVIDLSYKAAKKLRIVGKGTANVRLVTLPPGKDKVVNNTGTPETYTVQVAVFKNSDRANQTGEKLENSRVKPFYHDGSQYYRVMVGSFTAFEAALKARDEMRKQGYPKAYIIPNN